MPNRSAVRPEIQALRAVAVLSVVLYHLWPNHLPGGFVGVDVFFGISGFLITGHLLRELQATGTIRVGSFWGRRVRRLLPASLLVLFVTAVAVLVFVPRAFWAQFEKAVFAAVFYGENWLLAADSVYYLAATNVATPVQHFWSLGVEEQFYVAWPLLLLLATFLFARGGRRLDDTTRRRRTLTPVVVALGLVFVVSLIFSVVLTATNGPFAYFGTHARAWEFAAGGLVAALVPGELRAPAAVRTALSWLGWILIAVTLLLFTGSTPFPSYTALLPIVGTLLVIVGGAPAGRLSPTPIMAFTPVRWLGDVSYSLYLWHWPLVVIVPYALAHPLGTRSKVAILVVSIALAALTKRFVEDPFRGFGTARRRRNVWTYATAAIAMLIIAALPLGTIGYVHRVAAADAQAANKAVTGGQACFGAGATVEKGCSPTSGRTILPNPAGVYDDTGDAFSCYRTAGKPKLTTCAFGSTSPSAVKVAVVGDSHGAMLIPGLRDKAAKAGWHVTTYVGNGGAWRDPSLGATTADTTYLTNLDAALLGGGYDLILTTAHRVVDTTSAAGVSAAEAGMQKVWKRAQAKGITVVALRDNPQITQSVHDCAVAGTTTTKAIAACGVPTSYGLGGIDVVDEAAEAVGLPTADLTKYYCADDTCHAVIGSVIVYRDLHHITATYSRSIAPYLVKAVEAKAGIRG